MTEVEKLILFTNNARYSALTGQGLDFSVVSAHPDKKKASNPGVLMSEDHDWYQESPLCDTRTSYVYPKAALNQNLQWRYFARDFYVKTYISFIARYIFNLGNSSSPTPYSDYVQVVKVETCLAEGEQCNIMSYQQSTVCRQKFVHHRLVAVQLLGLVVCLCFAGCWHWVMMAPIILTLLGFPPAVFAIRLMRLYLEN